MLVTGLCSVWNLVSLIPNLEKLWREWEKENKMDTVLDTVTNFCISKTRLGVQGKLFFNGLWRNQSYESLVKSNLIKYTEYELKCTPQAALTSQSVNLFLSDRMDQTITNCVELKLYMHTGYALQKDLRSFFVFYYVVSIC